jgi:hypothetical protein
MPTTKNTKSLARKTKTKQPSSVSATQYSATARRVRATSQDERDELPSFETEVVPIRVPRPPTTIGPRWKVARTEAAVRLTSDRGDDVTLAIEDARWLATELLAVVGSPR